MVAAVFDRLRADRSDGGGLQSSLPHPPRSGEWLGQCPWMWASRPEPGAARPPPPGYCVLGPGVAQGWGPALGLWERIRGPALLPLSVNLIKDIPGMTEPCVLRGCPACGMHPHAAEQSPLLGWMVCRMGSEGCGGAWPCSRPQGPHGCDLSWSCLLWGPTPPLHGPSKEPSVLIA